MICLFVARFGGYYRELTDASPVYSCLLKQQEQTLLDRLSPLIPYPKTSTSRLLHVDQKQVLFDADYVVQMLSKTARLPVAPPSDHAVVKVTVIQEETTPAGMNNSSQVLNMFFFLHFR